MAHVLAYACFTQDTFTTTKKKNSICNKASLLYLKWDNDDEKR
ncbi:15564_t:CDS:2 [Entrophospora sp. SA101]|nr:15564_t:CDS:2 [Entrophospora sp. SA101]